MDSVANLVKAIKDLLDVFYDRFFLRDFLGKILPGFILLVAVLLFYFFYKDEDILPSKMVQNIMLVQQDLSDSFLFFHWIALVGICYVLGFCIQRLGEFLGLHSAHPEVFRKFLKWKRGKEAREKFFDRMAFFKSEKQISFDQKSQRERYAVIKEMTGNMAITFAILSAVLFWKWSLYLPYAVFLLIFSFLAYSSHCVYRVRQKDYEESIMASFRIALSVEINKMSCGEFKHYKRFEVSNKNASSNKKADYDD